MLKLCLYLLNAVLLLAGTSIAALVVVDAQMGGEGTSALPAAEALPGAPQGRVFALLVDSLRYETATDPGLMPHLVQLRPRATAAKMRTVRDAVTVPAVRAEFSGKDSFQIFGFVRNFIGTKETIPSLFRDLKALGR